MLPILTAYVSMIVVGLLPSHRQRAAWVVIPTLAMWTVVLWILTS